MDIASLAASAQTQNASATAFSSLTENLDTFLTLLTTQLQNQDPLEPLDTEQFTQQLVQFAGVEQSIQTNANLETLISLQSSSDRSSALELIGRNVTVTDANAVNQGQGATWRYELPAAAATVDLAILDSNGAVIATAKGASGAQTFEWNGRNNKGDTVEPGVYRLAVNARDANGAPVEAKILTDSSVTGVTFGESGPRLETPAGLISLDAVVRASTKS